MESKEELLSEVRYYKNLVNKFVTLQNEFNDYHTKPLANLTLWNKLVKLFVLYLISGIVFISILDNVLLFTITFVGSIYFLFVWPKVHVKKKLIRNQPRIREIQSLIEDLENNIRPKYIPNSYINIYALTRIETYLVDKRADTLKEALNLFEQEKRHDKYMREINLVQQMQEITYNKASEATSIGWINLFKR
ncbi:hypothetical protein [Salsuginibacillus kocurii]|uniref:hypothetical protein n=1 Tax=Salsuginibacillus kocurii TaxID=427078 RepID=UPI00037CD562|nr:hypothetical protein [Salsuginibacillus kocurii]